MLRLLCCCLLISFGLQSIGVLQARLAHDAAKSAARIAKAKQAHDTLMMEVHRSQAHALAIRARAEMRLAEEYDQAQEDGDLPKHGQKRADVASGNISSDLGLRRDEIHAARKLRDAEREEPGIVARTINDMVERGEVVGKAGGGDSTVASRNAATAADLGLRRDEIHEARKLRDAEAAEPGIVQRTINDMIECGEEPTST